jgi:hypothetical protein
VLVPVVKPSVTEYHLLHMVPGGQAGKQQGKEVELVPLDEILANGGDYLDDEYRERLHRSLEESIRQMKAGRTMDADP